LVVFLNSSLIAGVLAIALGAGGLRAQDAATAPKTAYNKVLGEVVAIDSGARKITVKTDNGTSSEVLLDDSTSYMRVPRARRT